MELLPNNSVEVNLESTVPSENDASEVSLTEAWRFLNALAGGKNQQFTFQTFDDNPKRKNNKLNKILHGTLDQCAQKLTRLSNEGAGIFVMVNEGDGKGRTAKNVVLIRANFVDLDGAPLAPVVVKQEMKP
ncbi:MAG: hypothetical protein ACLP5H_30410 [Desulfomonilaceae bacterium]